MSYSTPLEARIAKKVTKAIAEYNLIEDGDRVMVGLSGGKDSWALLQILDVLRKRAPIEFSLVGVTESEARAYAKERQLPIISCCCPACGDLGLQRQRVKRLIAELEIEHPEVKSSMIRALANVAGRHLLDKRVNPLPELR